MMSMSQRVWVITGDQREGNPPGHLAFDAAQDKACREIFLEERINHQDRDCTQKQLRSTAGTRIHHRDDLCVVALRHPQDYLKIPDQCLKVGL